MLGLLCYTWVFSSWARDHVETHVSLAGLVFSCGVWVSYCGGFSCCGAQALGTWASVVVAHRLSYSEACGIFLDQGSNLCPLHWQADSYP